MYKYKAYLINLKCKDINNKIVKQLVGEWIEDLPIEKFENSSDLMYCLQFSTKFFIRNAIKKAPYIRTYIYKLNKNEIEKIRVDFGSHYEFVDIYCENVGNVS